MSSATAPLSRDPTSPSPLDDAPPPQGSWIQPLSTGILAAVVGFASTFAILLQAFTGVGGTAAQAASGLLSICVMQGLLTLLYSLWWRQPISIVWSTPGAALMIATGVPAGGYPAAVGAVLCAGVLVVLAGLWAPFGRAVSGIPKSLAGAMLAGILFGLCLAPMKAMIEMPLYAAPIVLAWALGWRFARIYAVPVALVVAAVIVVFVTKLPPGALDHAAPWPVFTRPSLAWSTLGSLGVPLFIVTMAAQNVPGLAVLRANGYRPRVGALFVGSGLGSLVIGLFGAHLMNLAAVTAALCAGPDAHADPAKRYWSTVITGLVYIGLGLAAGLAAALVASAPPLLIQSVAGLALLGSFAGAMTGALADDRDRVPATVTFLVSASGLSAFGIGAAFWGLLAGGLLFGLDRLRGSGL